MNFTALNINAMKIAEDTQLEFELQELYIESSHLMSDVYFAEDEIKFFKKTLHKYSGTTLSKAQVPQTVVFTEIFAQTDADIIYMKNKILEFLRFIEPIINESKKELGLDLIEKFAALETGVVTLLESVKQIRKSLFSFIEDVMKTGCKIFEEQLESPKTNCTKIEQLPSSFYHDKKNLL